MKSKVLYILSIVFTFIFLTISTIMLIRQTIGIIDLYKSLKFQNLLEEMKYMIIDLIPYEVGLFIMFLTSIMVLSFIILLFIKELKNKQ